MNLFSDLEPETPAQQAIVDKIQRLADDMATWMLHEGRYRRAERPDPNDAPQHDQIVALIHQLCKLKEQGL